MQTAANNMPPGYTLHPGSCGGHWVRRPDKSFLRNQQLAPKWFPNPEKAAKAAHEDADQESEGESHA